MSYTHGKRRNRRVGLSYQIGTCWCNFPGHMVRNPRFHILSAIGLLLRICFLVYQPYQPSSSSFVLHLILASLCGVAPAATPPTAARAARPATRSPRCARAAGPRSSGRRLRQETHAQMSARVTIIHVKKSVCLSRPPLPLFLLSLFLSLTTFIKTRSHRCLHYMDGRPMVYIYIYIYILHIE